MISRHFSVMGYLLIYFNTVITLGIDTNVCAIVYLESIETKNVAKVVPLQAMCISYLIQKWTLNLVHELLVFVSIWMKSIKGVNAKQKGNVKQCYPRPKRSWRKLFTTNTFYSDVKRLYYSFFALSLDAIATVHFQQQGKNWLSTLWTYFFTQETNLIDQGEKPQRRLFKWEFKQNLNISSGLPIISHPQLRVKVVRMLRVCPALIFQSWKLKWN